MGDTNRDIRKLTSLQELRGVAVLLVMLVHAINVIDFRVERGVDRDPGLLATLFKINEFGCSGVDLFFVVSGFVMALLIDRHQIAHRITFLRMRFFRIVPPFWLAALAFNLLTLAIGRPLVAGELITEITIIPLSLYHYHQPALILGWTLAFELAFYLLVALALPMARPLIALTALLSMLIGASLLATAPAGLASVFVNPILLEFLFGLGAYGIYRARITHPAVRHIGPPLFFLGLSIMLMQALFGCAFDPKDSVIPADSSLLRAITWGLPCALIVAGHVLTETSVVTSPRAGRKFLRLTGDASYSLYLTHLGIFMLAEVGIPGNLLPADVLIAGCMMAGWTVGVIAYRGLEQPYLASLNKPRALRHTASQMQS